MTKDEDDDDDDLQTNGTETLMNDTTFKIIVNEKRPQNERRSDLA